MNQYYTHQPFLTEILENLDFTKDIHCLEFGTGDGSSSIFHQYALKYNNLKIDSFEHDIEWFNQMKTRYELPNYNFNLVDWNTIDCEPLKTKEYDFIFVDQGDWDSRIHIMDSLKKNTQIFLLHDYCYYNGFRGYEIPENEKYSALNIGEGTFFYEKYSDLFNLRSETELFPPTLILYKK